MNPKLPDHDDDRYLLIDDSDDDVTEILTLVAPSGMRPREVFEAID